MLTRIEALLAIAASGLTGAALREYVTLVADPVARLTALFPGADVSQLAPDEVPIPFFPNGGGEDNAGDVSLMSSGGPAQRTQRGLVASTGRLPVAEALWEFQPYVIQSTLDVAEEFADRLAAMFGKPVRDWTSDEMIDFATNGDHKGMREEFHDEVHTRQRKSARGTVNRTGPNLSTLCLYSGPVAPYDWCRFRGGWDSVTREAIPIAPAWLGTGDAALLEDQLVDDMRRILTQSRLDRVGISSAPHHGSSLDSDAYLWEALPNVRFVTIEANNKTGGARNQHPHKKVMDTLQVQNLKPFICTDGDQFYWSDKRMR